MKKSEREFNWRFWLKLAIPVLILILMIVFFGKKIWPILVPFLASYFVAYIFNPVVSRFEKGFGKFRLKRMGAVFLLYSLIIIIGLGIFVAVIPLIGSEVAVLAGKMPKYWNEVTNMGVWLYERTINEVPPEVKEFFQKENLKEFWQIKLKPWLEQKDLSSGVAPVAEGVGGFASGVVNTIGGFVQKMISGTSSVATFFVNIIMVSIISFYLLLDFDRFHSWVRLFIPKAFEKDIVKIMKRIDKAIGAFLRGQLLICLGIGIMTAIGLTILGVDYAILIGIVAGVCNIIPYLGPVMGATPAILVTMMDPEIAWIVVLYKSLGIIGVFVVIQMIDGFFMSPKVMSSSVNLHPMLILFVLMLGGSIAGLVGMIIAVPVACVIRILIQEIYLRPAGFKIEQDIS